MTGSDAKGAGHLHQIWFAKIAEVSERAHDGLLKEQTWSLQEGRHNGE